MCLAERYTEMLRRYILSMNKKDKRFQNHLCMLILLCANLEGILTFSEKKGVIFSVDGVRCATISQPFAIMCLLLAVWKNRAVSSSDVPRSALTCIM